MLEDLRYKKDQKEYALKRILRYPENAYIPPFTEWAENNRYVPPGTSPFPGMHSRETAPHFEEILERLHPDDPSTWVVVMKSVQSTATYHAECAIGAWIKYKIGSIGYYTATQELAKARSSANIDPMIDYSGLADNVKPHSQRNARKRADTTFYKEFLGGIKLTINSYGSIGGMKSNTIPFMILDEIDEARDELKNQGDIISLLEGRTIAIRNPKIFAMSTPTQMETSKIYKLFVTGDQRYYYVPCPHCGEYQTLVLKSGKLNYGLTFTREKDKKTGVKKLIPDTVRYICQYCGKAFHESKKQEMLLAGEWRATADAEDPKIHSYHINGLYSPEMFLSWERICRQYIASNFGEDLLKFKDFTINYLANPWARIESAKSWEELKARANDYTMGEPPDGPLRIYGGVDVQGDRLELMVVAVGRGMEKWVIDYQIFYGDPREEDNKCWAALEEFAYKTRYKIKQVPVEISLIAIDCGYKPGEYRAKDWDSKAHTVFNFVGLRQDKFIAVRGAGEMNASFDIIKAAPISSGNVGTLLTKRYDVNTHIIKEMIMRTIDLESGPQAIHFPRYRIDAGVRHEVGDELFRGFLSERYQEVSPGKMGWKKFYRRNEPFDTFIYATAAMYLENIHTYSAEFWDTYESALVAP